ELIEEYRRHQEGADPSEKLKNNVASKIYHIKQFLGYMAVGKTNLASMVFLNETNNNPPLLEKCGPILDYVAETPPQTRHGWHQMGDVGSDQSRWWVVVHEVAVKAAKEERLIPKSVLQKCRS
ncbi:hypothetical protein M9458_057606, partial [Cirrhinus mrigala]